MPRYKRTEIVEAVQWHPGVESAFGISIRLNRQGTYVIRTQWGVEPVEDGDWLVKNSAGGLDIYTAEDFQALGFQRISPNEDWWSYNTETALLSLGYVGLLMLFAWSINTVIDRRMKISSSKRESHQ
jgi:hypothetical protein